MRISDWRSDVCSSDLRWRPEPPATPGRAGAAAQPGRSIDPAGRRPTRHAVPATARPLVVLAARAQEKLEYLVVSPRLTVRPTNSDARRILEAAGIHPLLARLWAARGVTHPDQTRLAWPALLPPAERKSTRLNSSH